MNHKFKFLVVILLFLTIISMHAQSPAGIANMGFDSYNNPSAINTNFGLTQIGDVSYVGFRFQPEIAIGKLGFGLDVPVLFDMETWELRKDEFEDGVGYLRLINYVRWGKKKKDPLFLKVGDLAGSYLGFGILLNNYSNSISYEKRKIGLSFDFLIRDKIGLEGIYSDINAESFTLLALRPYFRPFGHTWIPIIKTIEFGVGYVMDYDKTLSLFESPTNQLLSNGMHAWSVDVGLFLLNTGFIDWTLYTQFGMLMENDNLTIENINTLNSSEELESVMLREGYSDGSGFSIGTAARLNVIGNILQVNIRLERLWYGNYFVPGFFDLSYELNKDEKLRSLLTAESTKGIYSTLVANLIDEILVGGGILLPDNINESHPAMVHLNVDIPDLIPKIIISGQYFKGGILDLNDALILDENSLAKVRVAYKILPFIVTGIDYKWSFITNNNGFLEVDHQIMPYVGIHIPLDFN